MNDSGMTKRMLSISPRGLIRHICLLPKPGQNCVWRFLPAPIPSVAQNNALTQAIRHPVNRGPKLTLPLSESGEREGTRWAIVSSYARGGDWLSVD